MDGIKEAKEVKEDGDKANKIKVGDRIINKEDKVDGIKVAKAVKVDKADGAKAVKAKEDKEAGVKANKIKVDGTKVANKEDIIKVVKDSIKEDKDSIKDNKEEDGEIPEVKILGDKEASKEDITKVDSMVHTDKEVNTVHTEATKEDILTSVKNTIKRPLTLLNLFTLLLTKST
eukprot:TRINITY_DN934_c0_g1_i1.p2 TRINITY_DN934_c0_g1~~TRINITY_DN934_c0_g1_i1.p2  ORF type:complete len:174 (-),score=44.19 TRINITY_DN934_c0_g1_i1:456-977(-)